MFAKSRFVCVAVVVVAVLVSALVVGAQDDGQTYITDDEALIFRAPEGWTLDLVDYEAEMAELAELGFELDFSGMMFGLPVTLESQELFGPTVDITVFYGQDLIDLLEMFLTDLSTAPTDPVEVLQAVSGVFGGVQADIEIETLLLPDGREVFYYDEIYVSDLSDLPDMDFSGGMFEGVPMPEGFEDEMGDMGAAFDDLMAEAFGQMGELFDGISMVTTDITRYYAMTFDNTGVVLFMVHIGGDIDTDDPNMAAMAELFMGLAGETDVPAVMAEFLPLVEAGPGEPVYGERGRAAVDARPGEPSAPAGVLSYTLPAGYVLLDEAPGYVVIANSPDVDQMGGPLPPGATMIAVNYGEEMGYWLESLGMDADVDLQMLALAVAEELGGSGELSTARFGAAEGYSFEADFADFGAAESIVYLVNTASVGPVLVAAVSEGSFDAQAERDVILFIVSMLQ